MTDELPPGVEDETLRVGRVLAGNDQGEFPVDTARWAELADLVLGAEGIPEGEMGLLFVDEAEMARLNEAHMGATGPTDVLSFPIDEVPGSDQRAAGADYSADGSAAMIGDVVVCPIVADRNAAAAARALDDEFALLVVHGVLHLLGMDHAEPRETERMQALERAYLAQFHR